MGEGEFKANVMVSAVKGALAEQGEGARDEMGLTTPGGRYQVRWDDSGGATMLGQLCVFRRSWTLIPRQAGHAFRSKLDSRSVATRGFGVLL